MVGLITGCKRSDESASAPAARSLAKPPLDHSGSGNYFKTPFQDESQFVVQEIITDIAEMISFARYGTPSDGGAVSVAAQETGGTPDAPAYHITVKVGGLAPIETKLTISGPIWSKAAYADVTALIAKSLELKSPSSTVSGDASMLERLADGRAETIARENLELSKNLQSDFTNPAFHEQAAVLLGAFSLRENSGPFYDIRLPLCRLTAHLALARFLAGDHPPGASGLVAESMLLTLINNEVGAIEQLKTLDTSEKSMATWTRTLRAYANRDFRPLDASTNVPGIEQIAWFWAYSSVNNRAVAWQRVGDAVTQLPDFFRVVAAMGYGVEMGNVMLQAWLPLEMREVRDVYRLTQGRELKEEDLVAALNQFPDRCFDLQKSGPPRVRVIRWRTASRSVPGN
jgi:hypothetical protein